MEGEEGYNLIGRHLIIPPFAVAISKRYTGQGLALGCSGADHRDGMAGSAGKSHRRGRSPAFLEADAYMAVLMLAEMRTGSLWTPWMKEFATSFENIWPIRGWTDLVEPITRQCLSSALSKAALYRAGTVGQGSRGDRIDTHMLRYCPSPSGSRSTCSRRSVRSRTLAKEWPNWNQGPEHAVYLMNNLRCRPCPLSRKSLPLYSLALHCSAPCCRRHMRCGCRRPSRPRRANRAFLHMSEMTKDHTRPARRS